MKTTLNGTILYYEATGIENNNKTPVLFLHGWGCNHTFFQVFVRQLDMPCITVDFPGHGESPQPPIAWGVPEYAEQIVQLLQELHIEKVNIVAHSFGGRVAIWLASHKPQLVGKMVLTGAAGLRKPVTEEQARKQEEYRSKQAFLNKMKAIPFMNAPMEKLQKKLRDKHSSPDYLALSESMKETFKKVINQDLEEYLDQIKSSVLLIWGENDTETPLWMGKKMQEKIADAALIVFPEKTHFAYVEDSQRFLLIMKAFFTEEGVS